MDGAGEKFSIFLIKMQNVLERPKNKISFYYFFSVKGARSLIENSIIVFF